MEDLKPVIARNIAELRRTFHLTQAELAQRLHYSDKAVSKWERAESVPDVSILKELSDIFGVTVDYLLEAEHPPKRDCPSHLTRRNRRIIMLLSVSFVVLVATVLFVGNDLFRLFLPHAWLLYVYAVPVSAVVVLVLNSIWGRRRWVTNCIILSVLMWSALLSLYLSTDLSFPFHRERWLLFILGIPAQAILLLWQNLRVRRK